MPVTLSNGKPNPAFHVAIENLGLVPTPDGTCASDNVHHLPGITCWYQTIPAQAPDPTQFDNSHGGSGFMLSSLDFYGHGDTRFAAFDWTGLKNLNSSGCSACGGIRFGGQLFSGVQFYFGEGVLGAQKSVPIPLGDVCGPAGLSIGYPAPASCPENGIATNGAGFTQVSQAQNQIWGAVPTEIDQTYTSESKPEVHQGAAYWVVGTGSFDNSGVFSLTSQGYVSPKHEDLEFRPCGPVRPRWGDYNNAIFLPGSGGTIYFATNYIQSPNCLPPTFTLTLATCGGTRDGLANWGTSVNSVVP